MCFCLKYTPPASVHCKIPETKSNLLAMDAPSNQTVIAKHSPLKQNRTLQRSV